MAINPIVKNRFKDIRTICIKFNIKRLYFFGSIVTGNFTINSDIDILVELEENLDKIGQKKRYYSFILSFKNYFNEK